MNFLLKKTEDQKKKENRGFWEQTFKKDMWLATSASGFNEQETMMCKIVLVGFD